LRKVCALFELKHHRHIDPDTSAYCQARLRLPLALLDKIGLRDSRAAAEDDPRFQSVVSTRGQGRRRHHPFDA
jgi:hypothetical protein